MLIAILIFVILTFISTTATALIALGIYLELISEEGDNEYAD